MIYVLYSDGHWQEFGDTWEEDESASTGASVPPDLLEPIRGFGKVWRENLGGPEATIGWATDEETGENAEIQDFERGVILRIGMTIYLLDRVEMSLRGAKTREQDDAVIVYVPGGTFQMGSTEGDSDEQPVHSVTLDSFWIDKYEVISAQFAAFLNERGNQTQDGVSWLDLDDQGSLIEQVSGEYRPKPGYDSHPVNQVTWYGAAAYCEWAGGRLPTEAEWEYAARGREGSVYPWGNEFDCSRGNFDDETQIDEYVIPGGAGCDGYDRTAPVGSFEVGASWCEAFDLAGNVWEWVNDWYQEDYYAASPDSNPAGPETGDFKVLRGGAWGDVANYVRSADRAWGQPDDPGTDFGFGFRCAADASP
jgi:formylglycine-generating enzyme required for sulfatase activity